MALRRIAPGFALVFADSAQDLRERLRDEEPGTVGAIVGHAGEGISEMNLAAAIARDGLASEVVLVARGASGSLRSRASRAGISKVVDATVSPALEAAMHGGAPGAAEAVRQDMRREAMGMTVPLEAAVPPHPKDQAQTTQLQRAAGRDLVRAQGPQARPAEAPRPRVPRAIDVPAIEREPQPQPADATLYRARPLPTAPAQVVKGPTVTAARPADSAPILSVVSGRGGVGKTSLTALMAGVAARWGMDVALVDLDLSCGNLHSCFGVAKGPDLVRIAPDGMPTPESMARSSVRCNERVHLWGPCERPEMAELVMPHVATLLSFLSTRFDLVLVDTSTTFTDGVAQAVQSCDRLMVVHDERPGAIASAARMSALAVRLGVARTRIVRIINLGDPRAKANAFEGRAEVGLETARMHRVVDGGVEAEELLSAGKVDELAGIDTELTMGVAALLAQTLAELGKLPDNEAARKAAEYRTRRHRMRLFGKQREAV